MERITVTREQIRDLDSFLDQYLEKLSNARPAERRVVRRIWNSALLAKILGMMNVQVDDDDSGECPTEESTPACNPCGPPRTDMQAKYKHVMGSLEEDVSAFVLQRLPHKATVSEVDEISRMTLNAIHRVWMRHKDWSVPRDK